MAPGASGGSSRLTALAGLAVLGLALLMLSPPPMSPHDRVWLHQPPQGKDSEEEIEQRDRDPVGGTSSPSLLDAPTSPPVPRDPRFQAFFTHSEYDAPSCISNCLARNQPQLRIDNASLPLPQCTERQAWCNDAYTPSKVREACELLCVNQYPANCSSAKYLVMIGEWPWGYGSHLHSIMMALTWSVTAHRVLIFENFNSSWTTPNDSIPLCAKGNAMCYYRPYTNCTLPSDWRSSAQALQPKGPEQHGVQWLYFWFYSNHFRGINEFGKPEVPLKASKNLTVYWWKNQIAQFLFRPNDVMLKTVVLPMTVRTFSKHPRASATLLPDKFVSLFIRAGDKYKEAALHGFQEYWPHLVNLTARYGIQDVYLSTDSARVLNASLAFISIKRPDFRLYYIDYPRLIDGLSMEYLTSQLWWRSGVRELINVATTDLFIASYASGWIGALSSNWCRMQEEMRLGNGRYGIPYISLDGLWIATFRANEDGLKLKG